jgi:hypothetical protein
MQVHVEEVMEATGLSRPEVVLVATRLVRNGLADTPVNALKLMLNEEMIVEKLEQKETNDILEQFEDDYDG